MTAIYAFGQYRLDVVAGILFRGAEPVAKGCSYPLKVCEMAIRTRLIAGPNDRSAA
jgi:hypothetical protein